VNYSIECGGATTVDLIAFATNIIGADDEEAGRGSDVSWCCCLTRVKKPGNE
jgi:hypothetical protein